MLFIGQKTSYNQWNFPAEVYPNIAGIVIFSICFAPISWLWFTLQTHVMHRKNAFMADKPLHPQCSVEAWNIETIIYPCIPLIHPKTNLPPHIDMISALR